VAEPAITSVNVTPAAPPSVVFTTDVHAAPAPGAESVAVTPGLAVSGLETADNAAPFAVRTSDAGPAPDGKSRLLLEFSNDCWVEIKDAEGNILTSGLMRANTTHTLSGPVPFKVTLGNAPAARLILDDRLVDTTVYVPRRGTVSRFTLDRE
jgi:cytoskeleton protein RodZ